MKDNLNDLIDRMVHGGLFLEEAVEMLERGMITRVLEREGGNQSKASSALGIHRNTLLRKMLTYDIGGKRPRPRPAERATAKKRVRSSRKAS